MAAVGLVHRNAGAGGATAGDTALQSLLAGDGHTVTMVEDSASVPGGIDCFVLSESCATGIGTRYTDLAVPTVSLDIGSWDDTNLASVAAANSGDAGQWFDLEAHEITAGLPASDCQVRSANGGRWGQASVTDLAAGAVVFAWHGEIATFVVGFAIDEGDPLTTGNAPARRVAIGYIDNWPPLLTTDGQTLLLQAVDWALGGGAITGTLAVTQADQTSSASGVLGYTGTVAVTQADQTLAASGVIGDNIGTVAVVQDDQTSAASGVLGYSGTLAVTQGGDTATASGTVTGPGFTGTVAVTQDDQTATASGTYDSSSIRDIKVLAKSGPVTSWRASGLAASPWSAGDPASGWRVRLPSPAVLSSTSPRSHWSASRPFVEQTVSEPS